MDKLAEMIYSLENEFLTVKINELGAELCSYYDKQTEREVIWQADPAHWKRHAPILFPIIGKVLNNSFIFENVKYKLCQHGFARDQIFAIVEHSRTSIKFKFSSTKKTKEIFPFDFALFVKFTITAKELKVLYSIENTSSKKIYFSLGAHPGFNCPFSKTSIFSDYIIKFEKKECSDRILLNADGFRTGKRAHKWLVGNSIKLHETLFADDALIFDDLKSKYLIIESEKEVEKVKISWNNYPHIGIWNPNKSAPFVCIEPWNGMADETGLNIDFSEKHGVISLDSGNKFECFYTVENILK